jgi:hypothetical protein
MSKTLQQILIDANAMLDLDAAMPTGAELTLRTNFADRAVWDAAATSQLKEFKRLYETAVTSSDVTLPLPSNFRELQDRPRIQSGDSWYEYEEIKPEDKYKKKTAERYSYILGEPGSYNLILNNAVDGTFSVVYQRFPAGFATLTSICELPDPNYVSTKIEALVLQGRGDDRFPVINAQAEQKLLNMVGRNMKNPGGGRNTTPVPYNPMG